MNYEIVNLKKKIVVGLTARTRNSDPNMGNVIGSMWNGFYENGIYATIGNKVNEKALGIYSDYASDVNGEYSATVACEVSTADFIPKNAVVKVIPEGKYAKFVVRGHMQEAVAKFWQELWGMELDRAYTCDFEEYQDSSIEDATIHVYIAMK